MAGWPLPAQHPQWDAAVGAEGGHGKGMRPGVPASQVVGRQYLVAKVTTTCDGDVAVETGPLGGEGGSRWGSCGRGRGPGGGCQPRGLP